MSVVIKADKDWCSVERPQVAKHRNCHICQYYKLLPAAVDVVVVTAVLVVVGDFVVDVVAVGLLTVTYKDIPISKLCFITLSGLLGRPAGMSEDLIKR